MNLFFSKMGAVLFLASWVLFARWMFSVFPADAMAEALKYSLVAGLALLTGLLSVWSDLNALDRLAGLRVS